tara:strand:- start:2928 stop:3656 length:729 start_codon:yes stop_codon:yes gene_type:complete
MKDIETKLFNLEETKKYFNEKKIKNIILFSQARSGSTFISNLLSEELGFKENFFPEEFFVDKHFSYLKKFVEKHDNFFISTNQFVYKRDELKKENTLHIYLHRNSSDILKSYDKAKKKGFYLGWNEFYSKYKTLFPTLKDVNPITLFNHKIWEVQISRFEHGITLSYESFIDNPKFVNKKNRDEKFNTLKQTDLNSNLNDFYLKYSKQKEIFEKKIKFNLIEKIYFKLRRLMESRKKNVKNY